MQDDSHDGHALPLKGVVLCSTSLSQDVRTLLAEISNSMGASHRLDLTTDVTHLIVGQVDTPKYKHVAKERPDIHVLKPEWIEAMRDAWRSGEDFDVAALAEQYRLPALYGLQICVTGFDDLDHRLDMIQSINDHGATYNGDLTRAVTHLIAKRPEGPKYDRAKQWGLKIVSLKWFQESLERGMALEEALYDPLRPEAMQGQGAFVREYQREPMLSKRNREDAGSSFAEESGKRKMRRTMSARLNSHSQNLWAEMSGVDDAPAPVKTEDEWNETRQTLEAVSHTRSKVSSLRDITPADISRPVSRATSTGPEPRRGLFHNCLFLVTGHPEKRSKKIREILQNEGGQIADIPKDLYSAIDSQSHSVTALIIPSEWTSGTREPLPDAPADTWLVTEWWIERCIVSKSIIDPDKDIYSRPRLNLSSDCFKGFIIGTSGLGNDAKLVQSIAKHAGGKYEEQFKPTCSVLLIRQSIANREKVAYAMKHNVPVVSEAWFQSCVNKGEKVPMEQFQMPPSNANDSTRERGSNRPPELLKRKDDSLAQRLSVTRKKSATPSLMLVKSRPVPTLPNPGSALKLETTRSAPAAMPFTEEEDSPVDAPSHVLADAQLDGSRSQPLQELPPRVMNSPGKRDQDIPSRSADSRSATSYGPEHSVEDSILHYGSAEAVPADDERNDPPTDENIAPWVENDSIPVRKESDATNIPVEATKIRLSEDIKSLLDRRKEASTPNEVPVTTRRRKERRLGRAPSNMSNPSAPASFMHSRSVEIADSTASASPLELDIPLPSQQLGYETADAKEHRARMSKRMGTDFTEGVGVRVESIGVVKDVDADYAPPGVAGRVRGRRHAKTYKESMLTRHDHENNV